MKLKIGRRSKYSFVTLVVTLLMCLIFVPSVMAVTQDEVYAAEYEMTWTMIPYGNGIDDDHDGVIDEDDGSEADVVYGTKDVNTNNNTIFDSWYNPYVYNGVVVAGAYEELWRVSCSDNVSVSPIQDCYYFSSFGGDYGVYTNVINLVTFYVNIPSSKLMNGASEFWYRSPIRWDDTVFDESGVDNIPTHFLNIYDESDNLVYASNFPNMDDCTPYPKNVLDDSGYERLYYKINMNFRTDVQYRFEEYAESANPIQSVDIFMARFQDVANDGQTNTYCFWNTSNARKIATECSWSCIFTIGKGIQGGEKIIFGGEDYSLVTQWFAGDPDIDDTGSLDIVFPLRTTRPLNITVEYMIRSGGDTSAWLQDASTPGQDGVCGTFIFAFNVTDNNVSAPNDYRIRFNFTNLDEDYNGIGTDQQAMTFYMFPSYGNVIVITNSSGVTEANHFACHIESANEQAAATSPKKGPDLITMLVGFAIIVIGIILIATVIGAAFGIPIIAGGITLGLGSAIAVGGVGVGALLLGTQLVWSGYTGQGLWDALVEGTARLINTVIKGVQVIAGAYWNGLIETLTKMLAMGQAILYYAIQIVLTIWEVFFFIAFIIVIYCWNWFLVLMKHIAKGDIESAFAHVKKPVKRYAKVLVKEDKKYSKQLLKKGKQMIPIIGRAIE